MENPVSVPVCVIRTELAFVYLKISFQPSGLWQVYALKDVVNTVDCWTEPAIMKLFKSHNATLYWLGFLLYSVILSFQGFVGCTNTYLSSHMWLGAAVHGGACKHLTSMEARAGNSAQWLVPLRAKWSRAASCTTKTQSERHTADGWGWGKTGGGGGWGGWVEG